MIQIVLPECSEDKISSDLRYLTEVLAIQGAEISGGMLGGQYGYGAYYENDTFMMHPYCWCDQDDCEWCRGCTCPDEAHEYRVEGTTVDFDTWLHAYDRKLPREVIRHEEFFCDYCKGLVGRAPNFLHKSSGTNIKWYKYIGRSMDVELKGDWIKIMSECMESLNNG